MVFLKILRKISEYKITPIPRFSIHKKNGTALTNINELLLLRSIKAQQITYDKNMEAARRI